MGMAMPLKLAMEKKVIFFCSMKARTSYNDAINVSRL